MTTFAVKFKHRVLCTDQGQPQLYGDVVSFSDFPATDGELPNQLSISTVKKEQYSNYEDDGQAFFLGINVAKPENKHLVGYRDFLSSNPHKVGLLTFNGRTILLSPQSVSDPKRYGYVKGFAARILRAKRSKVLHEASSNRASSSSGSSGSGFFVPAPLTDVVAPFIVPTPSSSLSFSASEPAAAVETTASHYNDLVRTLETRHLSQIFHLRALNNFVKSQAISLAADLTGRTALKVLDIACGKGGDLNKWLHVSAGLREYVGCDLAVQSLVNFMDRLKKRSDRDRNKISMLIAADLTTKSLFRDALQTVRGPAALLSGDWETVLPLAGQEASFDLVSCQFAMHYFFSSQTCAENFFAQVSSCLRPQGVYCATTIDPRVLCKLLLQGRHGAAASGSGTSGEEGGGGGSGGGASNAGEAGHSKNKLGAGEVLWSRLASDEEELVFVNPLGKRVLRLTFPALTVARLLGQSPSDWFGLEYHFQLLDKEEDSAVNAPEYLVPLHSPQWTALCQRHHLALLRDVNFHAFCRAVLANPTSQAMETMQSMGVFNAWGTINPTDWLVAHLYMVVFLAKTDASTPSSSSSGRLGREEDLRQRLDGLLGPRQATSRMSPSTPSASSLQTNLSAAREAQSVRRMAMVNPLADMGQGEEEDCPPSPRGGGGGGGEEAEDAERRGGGEGVPSPRVPPPVHRPRSPPATATSFNTAARGWLPSAYEAAPGVAVATGVELQRVQRQLQAVFIGALEKDVRTGHRSGGEGTAEGGQGHGPGWPAGEGGEEDAAMEEGLGEEGGEEEDEETLVFLMALAQAKELAGGEDVWDALDEDKQQEFMTRATQDVQRQREELMRLQ